MICFEDIKQDRFPLLDSNMFLTCVGGQALVNDPHVSHEHYDHTSRVVCLADRAVFVVCSLPEVDSGVPASGEK